MIDFHGADKPVGRERTWPNELTRESIRGHEYHILRYHRTLPPQHDCILPFTRFVLGPGDYTPTIFNPQELGNYTWAHELAQRTLACGSKSIFTPTTPAAAAWSMKLVSLAGVETSLLFTQAQIFTPRDFA